MPISASNNTFYFSIMKILKIDSELFQIVREINREEMNVKDWVQLEFADRYQTEHYVGGFDSIESAFTFSYYDENKNEYWFQVTLDEISEILLGEKLEIVLHLPQ
jgi:hypothetical protein